jgi:hypothetical protein
VITNPAAELDGFVNEMNVVIKHYKTLAAQSQGRRNAKKTAGDGTDKKAEDETNNETNNEAGENKG